MENYRCVKCFMPATSSVRNVDTLNSFPTAILYPKIETEDYLRQSIGDIIDILIKPNTQLPFSTYGDTTTSAVESITNLLQHAIPHSPQLIQTPEPNPTPEQTIPVPKQTLMNVPTTSPTMPTVPVQVQRFPIVRLTSTPVQVQRVNLK